MEEVLNAMESLKDELTCRFCNELARDPSKFGRCSHIFCTRHITGGQLSNCFTCHLGDLKTVNKTSEVNEMIQDFNKLNDIFKQYAPLVDESDLAVSAQESAKVSEVNVVQPKLSRNKTRSKSPPRKENEIPKLLPRKLKDLPKFPVKKTKRGVPKSSAEPVVSENEKKSFDTGGRVLRNTVASERAMTTTDENEIIPENSVDKRPVRKKTPSGISTLSTKEQKKVNEDKMPVPNIQNAKKNKQAKKLVEVELPIPNIIENNKKVQNKIDKTNNHKQISTPPTERTHQQEKTSGDDKIDDTPKLVSQNVPKVIKKPSNESAAVKTIDCNDSFQSCDISISSGSTVNKNLSKKNNKGETRLHSACVRQKLGEVEALLKAGASPNTKDHAGWCPLHEAVLAGNLPLATLLLQHGALPSTPSARYLTPLHEAVRICRSDLVELLLKYGANPYARDAKGTTPLDSASDEIKSLLNKYISQPPSANLLEYLETCISKENQTFVVYPASLSSSSLDKLQKMAAKHTSVKVASDLNKNVTHVIIEATNESCQVNKDTLMAVVTGRPILSSGWLAQCNDECLADARNFSITNLSGRRECVELSKINNYKLQPGLFDGCHFYFIGFAKKYEISSQLTVQKPFLCKLVEDGGGIVLKREPNPESIPENESIIPFHAPPEGPLARCAHFIIYQNRPPLAYNMAHLKSLPVLWLIECVQNFQLVDP